MKAKDKTTKSKKNSQSEAQTRAAAMATTMATEDRAQAAFERILPRIEQVTDTELAPTNTNIPEAALAAIGVAERVLEPTLYARFQSLSATEFDIAHVNDLSDMAWGTLYAANQAEKLRYVLTRARLPPTLLILATEVEQRMQACCEYHLADHPVAGPEVERLRAGHGHRDMAADLYGYTMLYKEYEPLLSSDKKHYRASDMEDAIRLSEEIYGIIGGSLTEKAQSASAQMYRAWTLLKQCYGEVGAAGRFLFRHDAATAEIIFPSLFTVSRSAPTRRRDDAVDEPAEPATLPAA